MSNQRPTDENSEYALAADHFDSGRLSDAKTTCQQVLQITPDHPQAALLMARVLHDLGQLDDALAASLTAVNLNPDSALALTTLGTVHQHLGNITDAEMCFNKAIGLNPDYASAYRHLSVVKNLDEDDPLITSMKRLYQSADISDTDKIELGFTLGKLYENFGGFDEAFSYLSTANQLKRGSISDDVLQPITNFQRMAKAFPADVFAQGNASTCDDPTPIFIVGMPRSGSSLVEQILASHPQVFGAGEVPHFGAVLGDGMNNKSIGFNNEIITLNPSKATDLAHDYIKRLRENSSTAPFITDKMLGNFLLVGFIRLLLPSARIIHVQRERMDNCFSIYSKLFSYSQLYSYDLSELGQLFRQYEILMEHWRTVIPDGMYEQSYEALIEEPEAEIQKLLEYCHLDFHEDCLNFHKTKRSVQTASAAQVRQPLNKKSLNRWQNFDKYLEPLRQALNG